MAYIRPLIEEYPVTADSVELFRKFTGRPSCFFLDSGMDPDKLGRYSFIGSDPFLTLKSFGETTEVTFLGRPSKETGNPLDILNRHLEQYRIDDDESMLPCAGGAVGYISYDIGRFIETLPCTAVNDLNLPECRFGFYDVIITIDNLTKKTYIVSTGFPEQDESLRMKRAMERLHEIKTILD
ncbi:MAG: aminodeoxychorismate synthase, component I, partial [Dehalococcoidales bacterium]|nr:aminodeoxychorismate synthase, component I [Dehalococcoidales bacterium]